MACTTLMPTFSADICAPNLHFGGIDVLLFTRFGDSLTDVSDDTEWAGRLNNSTALPSPPTLAAIRYLYGIGSLPLPERTEVNISAKRVAYSPPTHTITFNVDDTGATNAAALAALQADTGTYAVWFIADGQLYGGDTGIKATLSFVGRDIPGENTAIQTIQVIAKFEGALPAPIESPIQELVGLAA